MKNYYVNNNAQDNGDHEVHVYGCIYLPLIVSKTSLGGFLNSHAAVAWSKQYYYQQSNGCATCCPESHTS